MSRQDPAAHYTAILQRRLAFLQGREHKNSFDHAEISALEWALLNLPTAPINDRELDLLVGELDAENRLMRARNERLQHTLDGIVPRLEMAFGAAHAAPTIARKFIEDAQ